MQLLCLLTSLAVGLAAGGSDECVERCPKQRPSETWAVSNSGCRWDFPRIDHSYIMECCAQDFVSVTWYIKKAGSSKLPYPWGDGGKWSLCQDNQTLQTSSLTAEDTANYTCVVSNGTFALEQTFCLKVIPCSRYTERVHPDKFPNEVYTADLHERLELPCSGRFGCGEPDGGTVMWLYEEDGVKKEVINRGHYELRTFSNKTSGVMGVNLTFLGVNEDDYERRFFCDLSTVERGNHFRYNVTIKRPINKPSRLWIVAMAVGVAMVFFLIMFVFFYCHRPATVQYFCSRISCRLPVRDVDWHNDAFVLDCDCHRDFVNDKLVPKLQELGYRVGTDSDLPPGSIEVEARANEINRSVCTIVIYSQSTLEAPDMEWLTRIANHSGGPRNILVIQLQKLSKAFWRNWKRRLRNEETQLFAHAPQIFRSVVWPGDECPKKIKDFWYSVRRGLPRPRLEARFVRGGERVPRSPEVDISTQRPLLQSETDNSTDSNHVTSRDSGFLTYERHVSVS